MWEQLKHQGMFRLDIRKHFFTDRVVKHLSGFLERWSVPNPGSVSEVLGQCRQPTLTFHRAVGPHGHCRSPAKYRKHFCPPAGNLKSGETPCFMISWHDGNAIIHPSAFLHRWAPTLHRSLSIQSSKFFVKTRLKCFPNQGKLLSCFIIRLYVFMILYHKCSFISLFLVFLCNLYVRIISMMLLMFTLDSTANSVA